MKIYKPCQSESTMNASVSKKPKKCKCTKLTRAEHVMFSCTTLQATLMNYMMPFTAQEHYSSYDRSCFSLY